MAMKDSSLWNQRKGSMMEGKNRRKAFSRLIFSSDRAPYRKSGESERFVSPESAERDDEFYTRLTY